MNPRLKLAPHALSHALMAEMREALELMEAGNYDGAFELLELRCRPSNPVIKPPMRHANLEKRRTAAEVMRFMPEGLLRDHHVMFDMAVDLAGLALGPSDWIESSENALCAARIIGDFGVSLEVDYDPSQVEVDAMLAELKARSPHGRS